MEGKGTVVGKPAPDFTLPNQRGESFNLKSALKESHILLAFYPGDFTMVCTKQLCNYRDYLADFQGHGVRVFGVSPNPTASHAAFAKKYNFQFPLLSDAKSETAKIYGCTSLLMLGGVSRAVFIVSQNGLILYRYVEPTTVTRRKADELLQIIGDLKKNKLL